jgi:hypothetical protein
MIILHGDDYFVYCVTVLLDKQLLFEREISTLISSLLLLSPQNNHTTNYFTAAVLLKDEPNRIKLPSPPIRGSFFSFLQSSLSPADRFSF